MSETTEALDNALLVYPQVASVFPMPEPLEPLAEAEFVSLLERRYNHLAVYRDQAPVPPVSDEAATMIYRLFQGDLRGALRALQEGAEALVGYGEIDPIAPIEFRSLLTVLHPRYRAAFEARSTNPLQDKFRAMAVLRNREFTQADLQRLWNVSSGRVSQIVRPLQTDGYIMAVGRRGTQIRYRLTGVGLLVLGARSSSGAGECRCADGGEVERGARPRH